MDDAGSGVALEQVRRGVAARARVAEKGCHLEVADVLHFFFLLFIELLMTSNIQWHKNGEISICTTTRVQPITIYG